VMIHCPWRHPDPPEPAHASGSASGSAPGFTVTEKDRFITKSLQTAVEHVVRTQWTLYDDVRRGYGMFNPMWLSGTKGEYGTFSVGAPIQIPVIAGSANMACAVYGLQVPTWQKPISMKSKGKFLQVPFPWRVRQPTESEAMVDVLPLWTPVKTGQINRSGLGMRWANREPGTDGLANAGAVYAVRPEGVTV